MEKYNEEKLRQDLGEYGGQPHLAGLIAHFSRC
jgi:hypothetical protein